MIDNFFTLAFEVAYRILPLASLQSISHRYRNFNTEPLELCGLGSWHNVCFVCRLYKFVTSSYDTDVSQFICLFLLLTREFWLSNTFSVRT